MIVLIGCIGGLGGGRGRIKMLEESVATGLSWIVWSGGVGWK